MDFQIPTTETKENNTLKKNSMHSYLINTFNCEIFFLFFVLITLFFINLFSVVKNHLTITLYNIMKRAYLKLTKDDYRQFIKNESYERKKEKEEFEKIESNHKICTICLNKIDFDAMANCSHSFCGIYFF